jgi:hypothetical protein
MISSLASFDVRDLRCTMMAGSKIVQRMRWFVVMNLGTAHNVLAAFHHHYVFVPSRQPYARALSQRRRSRGTGNCHAISETPVRNIGVVFAVNVRGLIWSFVFDEKTHLAAWFFRTIGRSARGGLLAYRLARERR